MFITLILQLKFVGKATVFAYWQWLSRRNSRTVLFVAPIFISADLEPSLFFSRSRSTSSPNWVWQSDHFWQRSSTDKNRAEVNQDLLPALQNMWVIKIPTGTNMHEGMNYKNNCNLITFHIHSLTALIMMWFYHLTIESSFPKVDKGIHSIKKCKRYKRSRPL